LKKAEDQRDAKREELRESQETQGQIAATEPEHQARIAQDKPDLEVGWKTACVETFEGG
jgi:hypothetical protein